MDLWNSVYLSRYNNPDHLITNDASQKSFNLPDLIKQQMTSSTPGFVKTTAGMDDSGMYQSANYVPLSLSSQQFYHVSNNSINHGLKDIQSNLMDNLNDKRCLIPPNVIPSEFNSSWDTTLVQTYCLNKNMTAKKIMSKGSIPQKEPLPAHIGNIPIASKNNYKNLNLLQMNNSSSFLIVPENTQFNADNITFPTTPDQRGIIQESSNSSNNASQKLDHVRIERTNNSKVITNFNATTIACQPLQYISVPTNAGYSKNVLFLDKNYLVYDQKVGNLQTLHPNTAQVIPASQYSKLSEQLALGLISQPQSLTMTSNSHFVNSTVPYHQPNDKISLNSTMPATPSLPKKVKRGAKGNRCNSKNIKAMINDGTLNQKQKINQLIYANNESNFGQTDICQSQGREGLKSNEIIFENKLTLSLPSSLSSVDHAVFGQLLNSENFTSVEQTCTSNAQFLNTQLVKFDYSKFLNANEQGGDSQMFLTNTSGKKFVSPDEISNAETNNLGAFGQVTTGKRITLSMDKQKKDVQMKKHFDDEFSHLVKDPMPLQNPKILYSKCKKRTFMDCFIDFLQGKKQETLSSLINVPITKRPDLPKYIPEFTRKITDSKPDLALINQSDTFDNSSNTMPFESVSKANTSGDRSFMSFDVSGDLKLTKNGKKRSKQTVKRKRKKSKIDEIDGDKSALESDSTDILDESSFNNGYDSSNDPLWYPKKAVVQSGSSIGDKKHSIRKRSNKISDQMSISKKAENFSLTKCQEGDFLIDKKDFEKLNCTACNIWRVDSNRLLQKYEPFSSSNECLHKPTSVYSSWSENMLGNYFFLKVRLHSSKLKSFEVMEVIKEEINKRGEFVLDTRRMQCVLNNYIKFLLTDCHYGFKTLDQNQCKSKKESEDMELIDKLFNSYKEKIKNSVKWSSEFFTAMEQHSLMTMHSSQDDKNICQVSGIGKADKIVRFHGEKYDPESLLTLQVLDEARALEFYISSNISEKMHSYHGVYSLKFWLFNQCNLKLKELKDLGIEDDILVESSFKDESWMSLVKTDFIQTLRYCENFLS